MSTLVKLMHRLVVPCAAMAAASLLLMGAGQGQSQTELNQQAYDSFEKADRRLNSVYSGLLSAISAAGKASLRKAQVSWLQFRDQECEFETMATVGGSIHSMLLTVCKTRLTLQRVADLEHQLNCQEGDLSCARQ